MKENVKVYRRSLGIHCDMKFIFVRYYKIYHLSFRTNKIRNVRFKFKLYSWKSRD